MLYGFVQNAHLAENEQFQDDQQNYEISRKLAVYFILAISIPALSFPFCFRLAFLSLRIHYLCDHLQFLLTFLKDIH